MLRHVGFSVAEHTLGLLVLMLCIVAITWPWAQGFGDSFVTHQDPPLHAWKVWNMADALLHGKVRPPGNDLNAYYPHSGSLYYESLYWPQAVVAAPVLALTKNPVLAFHLSYLFFWALSGVFFKAMMRELGAGRAAAWMGGLIFTVMPFRTGYVAEFNMQLCFGLPLAVWALSKWARAKSAGGIMLAAAGFAGAVCLQAVSELYQAVFFTLALPFVILALGRGRWAEWLRGRRLWVSLAPALVIAAATVALFLAPYAGQLGDSVSRGLREISQHELEPFSYFASAKHMRWNIFPKILVKEREICVYPTFALGLVALEWLMLRFRRHWKAGGWLERGLRTARAVSIVAFFVWTGVGLAAGGLGVTAAAYAWMPVAIAALSLAIPLIADYRDECDRLLDGLCGAAVFAFLMGLGPVLSPFKEEWRMYNPLYMGLFNLGPALGGFRVVARFAILVMMFLAAAATLGLEIAFKAARHARGRRAVVWTSVIALGLALSVAESVPLRTKLTTPATPYDIPMLDRLVARTGAPAVLAVIPGAKRELDSRAMFRITGTHPDRLTVMSWGGAFPPFTVTCKAAYRDLTRGRPDPLWQHLSTLWPECRILLDKNTLQSWFPDPEAQATILDSLARIAVPEDEDGAFVLWHLRPPPPSTTADKFIRMDLLSERPVPTFRLTPEPDCAATVAVEFGGNPVAELQVPPGGTDFRLELPPFRRDLVAPAHLRFVSDVPFSVEDFHCEKPKSNE